MKLLMTILVLIMLVKAAEAQTTNSMNSNLYETAVLGGGCFWCVEAVYIRLPGVVSVTSGYTGGHTDNPTYHEVCSGTTGHAEVAKIIFDSSKISFDKILEVFWQAHDPTTLNRQGADEGTQYRSVIFYTSERQKLVAEKSKLSAQAAFHDSIVTEIAPLVKFYPAEDYHQAYYETHTNQSYCRFVIRPKLEKLEHKKVIESIPPPKI